MNSVISWFKNVFSSSGSENVHVEQNIEEHMTDNIVNDDIKMDEQDLQDQQDLEDQRWLHVDLSIFEDRDSLDLKGETLSSEEKSFIGRLANEGVFSHKEIQRKFGLGKTTIKKYARFERCLVTGTLWYILHVLSLNIDF